MSGHRHRNRLRHIANPHCWFRRPSDDSAGSSVYSVHPLPVWGLPADGVGDTAEIDSEREREREEDEYNMALALSLSANEQNSSISLESQEEAQLARAKQDSMAPCTSSGAAESLSWSLFTSNCLGWEDTICDGLYDVWGQFPEILEIAPDSGLVKLFPSLEELRKIPFTPGDSREVVVVDHDHDEGLCTIDEIAAEAVSNAIKHGAEACVQALARVVVDSMGGPSSAGELAQRCWDSQQQLKYRKNSLVLPIGEVKVGLARHRALLFKSLADACRLPCKVIRGEHLGEGATGDRAAVMVRAQERLYSVDLFSAKLRLIGAAPADGQVSARQSVGEGGGLDWAGDVDGPALLPMNTKPSQERPGSGHNITPSIDAAFDTIDAKLQRLNTADELLERLASYDVATSSGADNSMSSGPARSGSVARAQYVNASLAKRNLSSSGPSADFSSTGMPAPEYPPIVYSKEIQRFSESPATPHPFLQGSTAGDTTSATSSFLERMGQQPSAAAVEASPREAKYPIPAGTEDGVLKGIPAGSVAAENPVSPFQNVDFQSRPSMEEDREYLGGSFEFINGRVAEVTPPKGQTAEVATELGCLSAPSPFADPALQDSEVPYDNLPVDKGHLIPILASDPRELEMLSGDEAPAATQGLDNSAAVPAQASNNKWKLRALANIRRHSDSDIFLDSGRRSTRERLAERLDALPEVTEALPQNSPAGDTVGAESQVPPAKPLSAVSHVASGDASSSGIDMPDEWEIRPEEIKLGPRIGIGSFGEVYRGTWRYTDVAVKRLLDQELSPQLMEEFRAEISIMKRLRHVNVLLFLGAVSQPPDLAIVTQFMPRGSLFRLLHRTPNCPLDEKRRLRMAVDIARGMNYLHSCVPPIVHRDLKTPNLLVDKDFTIKVCDFGLSRVRMSTVLSGKSQAGTPEWTAPEVLRGQSYDESSDCYSFGVVLWELLTTEEPWQDKTAMQVVGAVGWGNARLQIPSGTHPALASLILRCWSEPRGRPSFAEILNYLKPLKEDIFVCPPRPDAELSAGSETASDFDR